MSFPVEDREARERRSFTWVLLVLVAALLLQLVPWHPLRDGFVRHACAPSYGRFAAMAAPLCPADR